MRRGRGACPVFFLGVFLKKKNKHTKHVGKVNEIFLYISPLPFHTPFRGHVNTLSHVCKCCKDPGCTFTPVSTVLSVISRRNYKERVNLK